MTTTPGSAYRFDHPRLSDIMNDMFIRSGELAPGDTVPPFALATTDGRCFSTADLQQGGRPVVVVFGSRTCPVTESAVPGLKALHARHKDRFRFVLVQVREAHPGAAIPQPHTAPQKLARAIALQAHHDVPFEVAIDDLDGTWHRALGARPNSAFVIDPDGVVLFRAQWANETAAIAEALDALAAGSRPPRPTVTRTVWAVTRAVGHMAPVLRAAGRGALLDTWKVAPPMGLMMIVSSLFGFLPERQRGWPTMAVMFAAAAGLAALFFHQWSRS